MTYFPGMLIAAMSGCTPEQGLVDMDGRVRDPEELELDTESVTEDTYQVVASDVDFLLIIDDSGSMEEKQEKLTSNFHKVFRFFDESNTNYQIGVTTTDMVDWSKRGKLQRYLGFSYITPETDGKLAEMGVMLSAEDVFVEIATVGTAGSAVEKGLEAAHKVLSSEAYQSEGGANDGFLRSAAGLHITVVSDERDSSVGPWEDTLIQELNDLKAKKTYFFTHGRYPDEAELEILKLSGEYQAYVAESEHLVKFHSIVGLETSECAGVEYGPGYGDVTEFVGGKEFDICDEDWGPMMDDLGIEASQTPKRKFALSDVPIVSTIEFVVTYEEEGSQQSGGYTLLASDDPEDSGAELLYERSQNTVLIKHTEDIPPLGAKISITYDTLVSSH